MCGNLRDRFENYRSVERLKGFRPPQPTQAAMQRKHRDDSRQAFPAAPVEFQYSSPGKPDGFPSKRGRTPCREPRSII
jgi:hypothetical protein